MDLSFLPAVNASLNALAVVLIIAGVINIKRKRIDAHKKCMLGAFATSGLFLVFYLVHYAWRAMVKGGVHTRFSGPESLKPAYYGMLFSHILLAMLVPVLAIMLIRLGLRREDERHRRLAKFAVPIWLYVSVTGVLIYLLLYHWYPAPATGG